MTEVEKCFIMLCDNNTEEECLRRNLFGDKAKRLKYLDEIRQGHIGLLFNINKDELLGIFRACSEVHLHIEPDAWGGKFAAQVSVEPIGELQRISDATYILNKVGVGMGQLNSGLPAPQFPVHGRDVLENILTYFQEPPSL